MKEFLFVLEILKWPIVVIFTIFLLRKSLSEMINGIIDFSIGGKNGLSARVQKKNTDLINKEKQVFLDKKYLTEEKSGLITFNYSNNNGVYVIGKNDYRFDTMWTKASNEYIHFYNDKPTIKNVRIAKDVKDINFVNPNKYDSSSRSRTVGIGQFAIFENMQGNFLIIKIINIKDDTRGDSEDELTFEYKIIDG